MPEESLMADAIPEKYRDLFDKKAFASLTTLMPDGSPQVTPVWVDYDGKHVVVNTAKDRVKDRNMRRDPRVSLAIIDPDNPYRYLEVRGRVANITENGADAHIDKMAKKYLGADKYPYRQPGEVRVLYKIAPEKYSSMG
jgi:PPOX class probable F420-dependent enzyme